MKNRICLFALVYAVPAVLVADPPRDCERIAFVTHIVESDISGVRGVSAIAADIDGDGMDDIVAYSAATIFWFRNTGRGVMSTRHAITQAVDGTMSLFTADIDGDGDLDVLSASIFDSKIAWYRNIDGRGAFGPQKVITTQPTGASSVSAVDLDGDGDMDVLSAALSDDSIAWYENIDGLGNFGPMRKLTDSADRAFSVVAADLDGDGDADVLSSSFNDSKIAWFENTDGKGTFGPERIVPGRATTVISAIASDVDGDGDLDIVAALSVSNAVTWYENLDGSGNFGDMRIVAVRGGTPFSIFATDLDADGDTDVVLANGGSGSLAWAENLDGKGTFGSRSAIISSPNRSTGLTSVFPSDVDGDGDLDVVAGGLDWVAWYENEPDCNGNGVNDGCDVADGVSADCNANDVPDACDVHWQSSTDCNGDEIPDECEPGCNENGQPDECDIADGTSEDCDANGVPDECDPDCNGSGKPDLCDVADGTSSDCNGNEVPDECDIPAGTSDDCNNNGVPDECDTSTGTSDDCNHNGVPDECDRNPFQPDTFSRAISPEDQSVQAISAADIDGDGDTDVVVSGGYDGDTVWYENADGSGSTWFQRPVAKLADPVSLATQDVDGDGDIDIVSGSTSYGPAGWYENLDGAGTFGKLRVISADVRIVTSLVQLCDVDSDGDPDIVAVSDYETLVWHENFDGRGNFSDSHVIIKDAVLVSSSFLCADLDADGVIEVLLADARNNQIADFEFEPDRGEFGPSRTLATLSLARSIATGDVDADGDQDLVVTSRDFGGAAVWFENTDGRGNFSDMRVITENAGLPDSIETADFDADGDDDVLFMVGREATLFWFESVDGPDRFVRKRTVTNEVFGASFLVLADVDGDNDSDLLVPLYSGAAWIENTLASKDCNRNATPDECDLDQAAGGISGDCDANSVPDECQTDTDADGLIDDCDLCAESSADQTIIIGDCDTGVANLSLGDGCTMADAVEACQEDPNSPRDGIPCVRRLAHDWRRSGIITLRERRAIMACVASTSNPHREADRSVDKIPPHEK